MYFKDELSNICDKKYLTIKNNYMLFVLGVPQWHGEVTKMAFFGDFRGG